MEKEKIKRDRKKAATIDNACGMESGWQEIVSGILGGFFKNFSDSISRIVREKIDDGVSRLKKAITGSILIGGGMTFLLTGAAFYLNAVLGVGEWPGFIVVGLVSVILGGVIFSNK